MPYKHTDKLIPAVKGMDKRIKLSAQERGEIRANELGLSNHALAKKYGVSRRLVQFIRFPERHKENLIRRAERGGSMKYYDKEYHKEAMKKHRRHKQELFLAGKLV